MLFLLTLITLSLATSDAGTTAAAATSAAPADTAAPGNTVITYTADNLSAFGSMEALKEILGESDAAGGLIQGAALAPGQQIVMLPGQDAPTIIGPGASTTYQCDSCDFPVTCIDSQCTTVRKAEHDGDLVEIVDGRLLSPVLGLNGQPLAAPALSQMGISLLAVDNDTNDLYKFDGFEGADNLEYEDLLDLQRMGLSVNSLSQVVPQVSVPTATTTPVDQAALVTDLGALYTQFGGENPMSNEDVRAHPDVTAFAAKFTKVEDTVWGESDALVRGADGSWVLNVDNFDDNYGFLLMSPRKTEEKKVFQDPFFWTFCATSVILVSLLGVMCTRKRRNVTLDDVLMETNYSSHV